MPETIRKILCATDLTVASEPAVRSALNIARQFHVPMVLLHIVEQPYRPNNLYTPFSAQDREYLVGILQREEEAAKRLMHDSLGKLNPLGASYVHVDVAIRRGVPSDAIAAAALDVDADLLVVGTHGRTGLSHMLLGSVAERLVRTAACQVLVVRQSPKRAA